MSYRPSIEPQLERVHATLDALRRLIPIAPRESLVHVYDNKIQQFIGRRELTAITPIVPDAERVRRADGMEFVLGIITPPHYLSPTEVTLGFYVAKPYGNTTDEIDLPIGIGHLPYDRYVIHVYGACLDSEGSCSLYEKDSLFEAYSVLRKLPIYTYLKQQIAMFPTPDNAIGRKNAHVKRKAIADLQRAESR